MDLSTFLIQLVLILLSARIFGEIAAYFRIPSVIGELAAGIIIGPSLFGLVEMTTTIHLLAEIGIILLLFEVGLETDSHRLLSVGMQAFVVASAGVILPFIIGFVISYYLFHFSLLVCLFIGSTLTATSTGITMRVLRDLKKHNSAEAHIILGAAVIDDVICIILLALLYEFSKYGEINLWNAGKLILFIIIFFIMSPIIVKCVSLVIQKWDEQCAIPGLLPTTIVSIILLWAWIAQKLGAPELLGGFAAGLALSKKFFFPFSDYLPKSEHFSQRIEQKMRPIVNLFTPIFFISIGLSLNLKEVNWQTYEIWFLMSILTVGAIIGKLCSGFFLIKQRKRIQLIVGTAMTPRGEVGLIFANIGLAAAILKNDSYTVLILVIAVTTLLAPFWLRWLYRDQLDPTIS